MPLRNLSEHLHIHRGSEASVHERKDSAGVAHASTKLFRPRVRSDSVVREFGRAATMGTAIVTSPNSTDAIHSFCKENLAPLTSFSARFMTAMTTAEDFEEFINATHITIAGLEKIAAVFPFAAAAVIAFKALVGAHIRRKENNRKVLVVRAKIYDFCIALFELRHVRDPQAKDTADITLEVRMANLMQDIAQDIKWAGLVCETYEKKNALVRTLKAKIYEDRLASQINLFQRHREQFQFLLNLFINTGVQSANRKLDDASGKLQSIETKLDDIHNLFRQLDSPKEQKLRGIVDRHGPATFLEDDSLLAETMQKVYEVDVNQLESDTMDTSHHYHDPNLAEFKRELLRELSEDLDATLAKNFNVFNQKLEMHNQHLMDAQRQQAALILFEIRGGSFHERIRHKDMRAIWKEMGWKGSVKARHFILALRDYFVEKYESSPPTHDSPKTLHTNLSIDDESKAIMSDSPKSPTSPAPDSDPEDDEVDCWTHSYINVNHVQPILEAIDDDATGFITIKEVNMFTSSRLDLDWTLPCWIAFWAVGWQTSIDRYKSQIYTLLEQMIELSRDIRSENRTHADKYLSHPAFNEVEQVLRVTKPPNPENYQDSELMRYVDQYTTKEEATLEQRLTLIAYDLDAPATVSLVTGPGRIERFLYPLVYLILKRHVQILHLATTQVLDGREFSDMTKTLVSLLAVVHERVEGLVAVFRQGHSDVKDQMNYFAFGMFSLISERKPRDPKNNTILLLSRTAVDGNIRRTPSQRRVLMMSPPSTKDILRYEYSETCGAGEAETNETRSSQTWHLGIKCDACRKDIRGPRLLCLVCINQDFSENIDLCSQCRHQSVKRKSFSHEPSHALLQVNFVILDPELAVAIPKAQATASQTEDRLRSSYDLSQRFNMVKNFAKCSICGTDEIPNVCCKCVHCSYTRYYCASCERECQDDQPGAGSGRASLRQLTKPGSGLATESHSFHHHVVCVGTDGIDGGAVMTATQKLDVLERQFAVMQNRLTAIEDMLRRMFIDGGNYHPRS